MPPIKTIGGSVNFYIYAKNEPTQTIMIKASKQLLILGLVLFSTINLSHAQTLDWAFGIGDTSWDESKSITVDLNKNVIVGGSFAGPVDFDPGVGSYIMNSSSNDGFVAKYDSLGNFIWAQRSFEFWSDEVNCVITDSIGNVYSSGKLRGSKSFIEKRDSNGVSQWQYQFGNNSGSQNYTNNCSSIAIDDSGNVYGTGWFSELTTFNSIPLVQLYSPMYVSNSLIIKLNALGNLVWVKQIKDSAASPIDDNIGNSIALDKAGNIYITGAFKATVDFNPDSLATYSISSAINSTDIYILKLSNQGNFIWAKNFYNTDTYINNDMSNNLVLNDSADLFITGSFSMQNTDFDPGPGNYYLLGGFSSKCFVCRLDSAGSFKMAKMFRNANPIMSGTSQGFSIGLDPSENIYIAGPYSGTIDFDPDTTNYILSGVGGFIARLNQNGNFLSVINLENYSEVKSIYVKDASTIYSTGSFRDTVDFDPSMASYLLYPTLSSQITHDAFVWKLNLCNSPMQFNSLIGCDSINIQGQTYFNSGTYLQTLINSAGCDSTIQWELTINKSSDSLMNVQACDSFQYNGSTYFASGMYQQTFINSFGCDSIIHLQVVINNSNDSLMNVQACDSLNYNGINYTVSGLYQHSFTNSSGCDSIVNLQLTILQSTTTNQAITACNDYFFDGVKLTNSGTYSDTLISISGCDSIIILNLIINSIDTSVTQNGITLTANSSGLNYAWLNCNNNFQFISGANNQSYTASANGNYSLLISDSNCSDTSLCYSITTVSSIEIQSPVSFSIYPNPFTDELNIQASDEYSNTLFEFFEITGKKIFSETLLKNSKFFLPHLDQGIYLYSIRSISGKTEYGIIVKK